MKIKTNSRQLGKSFHQFELFRQHIKQGRNALYIGLDYVVMSNKNYNELVGLKTKVKEALKKRIKTEYSGIGIINGDELLKELGL